MSDSLLEIPGYTVHGRLGKGGMAEVYLATQQSLQRKVAIKVLLSGADQEFNTRFIQEGHIIASLTAASVITIYDIDRLPDGRYYLAMEFVSGGDLAQHKGEVFAPERALAIVQQIASGLAVVHEKGLVHRDIKPANILFRTDGSAVITDFGIAKDLQIDTELTHVGIAVGSPAYSSPEQTQCQRLDARSDIYSLGVIFLEMLCGTNPYRAGNFTQTAMNHVQMPVPALPEHLAVFQPVLNKMLGKDPAQRFSDCRALLNALDAIELDDMDATQLRPAAADAVITPEAAAPTQIAAKRRSMMPLLVVLALVVALFTLATLGLYVRQQMQIDELLVTAEQRFVAGQLLSPELDSATYFYQQVLLLDADNAEALAGLQRITDKRIADWLSLAEQRAADQQLTEPVADNALYYYRQVLSVQADQPQALAAIQQLAEHFKTAAEAAYAKGNFPAALVLIEKGLLVQPEHPQLLKMHTEHQQLLASARAAQRDRAKRKEQQPAPSENPVKQIWNNLFGE